MAVIPTFRNVVHNYTFSHKSITTVLPVILSFRNAISKYTNRRKTIITHDAIATAQELIGEEPNAPLRRLNSQNRRPRTGAMNIDSKTGFPSAAELLAVAKRRRPHSDDGPVPFS